jgi:hypothetical protein
LYLSYFLYAIGDYFPYLGSGYRFGGSLHGLFWWDLDPVADGKYRHYPMAAIGRWVYGLVECHGRYRSDFGQLHDCWSHKH